MEQPRDGGGTAARHSFPTKQVTTNGKGRLSIAFGQPPAVATHVTRGFTMEIHSFDPGSSGGHPTRGARRGTHPSLAASVSSSLRPFLPTPATEVYRASSVFGITSNTLVRSSQSSSGPAGGASDGYGLGRGGAGPDRRCTTTAAGALRVIV